MTRARSQPGAKDTFSAAGGAHPTTPVVDDTSAAVLNDAMTSLAMLRHAGLLGDAVVRLHDLASLMAQADAALPDMVAEARDQDYTWTEIGDRLGLSPVRVWWCYGRPSHRGHGRPVTD